MHLRGGFEQKAHGYFDIDLDVVWETTQEWLPGLLEQLLVVCRGEGTDNHDEVES